MKTKLLLAGFATALFLTSCQKESSEQQANTNNKLIGTWKTVGLDVSMKNTAVNGSGATQEKLVSSYSFKGTNVTGTVVIDSKKMTSTSVAYSYSMIVNTEMYLGGVLFDSFQTPYSGTMPPSGGFTNYTVLSEDSLRLEGGFVGFDATAGVGGTSTPTVPSTCGVSWKGDTLVLRAVVTQNTMQVINGVNAQVKAEVDQTVYMKK
jgi:hypothetical protein